MNTEYYKVPETLGGKTLRQLTTGGNSWGFNPDTLSRYLGITQDTPLTAGQTFSTANFDKNDVVERGRMKQFFEAGQSPEDELLGKQKSEMDARYAQNRADITGLTDAYGAKAKSLNDEVSSKYNIPMQVGAVNALNNRINELKLNLNNEGGGGYASSSQVDAALNTNYLPKFSLATTALGTSQLAASDEYSRMIAPEVAKVNAMTDQIARESTGYTAQQQRELDTLLAKMSAGVQLSVAEMNNATTLAVAEKTYQATLAEIAGRSNVAKLENQYKTVDNSSTIYDVLSGRFYSPYL